ncbi:MAG: Unknown protein [uncultured Sulfurovum sp.]|uniref:Uncharacterized protein n=1 Tax=uncultured Sulfurovum sp. TaxID=269237 RepID=A0A6S6SLC8_9BACT|nr:MAG: Unknown protein [uncultured Sulfurovum sp.]
MSIGEIFYVIAVILFSYMTFAIIRGNFQRKFDENGHRHDLKEKKIKEDK